MRHYPINPEPPKVALFSCVDWRFIVAIEQFMREELGLKREQYLHYAMAAGAGPLAHKDLVHEYATWRNQLDIIEKEMLYVVRIFLIGHANCIGYKKLVRNPKCDTKQPKTDLAAIGHEVSLRIPRAQILGWYAHLDEGIKFEPVTIEINAAF